jgi:hypothetical protein
MDTADVIALFTKLPRDMQGEILKYIEYPISGHFQAMKPFIDYCKEEYKEIFIENRYEFTLNNDYLKTTYEEFVNDTAFQYCREKRTNEWISSDWCFN